LDGAVEFFYQNEKIARFDSKPTHRICPVPRIRNNFFRLISQSLWPSFVKYTAAGVR
jgi:hypothetical protein